MKIDGFDWDEGNSEKSLNKHGISRVEIEYFFKKTLWIGPDFKHSAAEERFLSIGKNINGRYMFVAFTIRKKGGRRLIRPISARYMHSKEIKKYEEEIEKN